jgi:putative ABC transport system permease protein
VRRVGDLAALLREWLHRLRETLVRRRSDGDLARELAFHLEQAELDLRGRGHSVQEAHRLARALAGNPDAAIEALRMQGGVPWVGTFTLDVTLGLRMLRKYWGLSLVGGLALAVVIGICTATYLYFNVFWSTDLPIEEGDRVVAIQVWDPVASRRSETSLADFDRWQDGMDSLEDVAAFRTVERNLVVDGQAGARVAVAEMSAAGFRVARTPPLLGRSIVADDERPSAPPVVVIGYDEWQRRFDGDPNVLGRALRLDDSFHAIVGVMPAEFGFPLNHRLWIPLRSDAEGRLAAPPLGSVFARLASGFELANAQAELTVTGLLPDDARAQDAPPPRLLVLPYAQNFIDDIEPDQYGGQASLSRIVILLMSLLLVPPGLNIAVLVYARTATRQEEIAVRTALGASRRRIVVQLFVEMLVLAAVAAVVALTGVWLVARYVEGLLVQQLVDLPFWIDVGVSTGAIVFAAALALTAALLMGLMPALRATRQFARPAFGGVMSRNRARLGGFWTVLIVSQIGFSFAMLPVAMEIAWGTLRAHLLGPGFRSNEYVSAQLSLATDAPVERGTDVAARTVAYTRAQQELVSRVGATPDVIGATLVSAVPGAAPVAAVELETKTDAAPGQGNGWNLVTRAMRVDAAFFATFEARPLRGRGFTGDEFSTPSRSIVVSERFVETTLHGANPLGLRLRYARPRGSAVNASIDETWYEIVGVVPNVPAHAYSGTVYHPLGSSSAEAASIVLRVAPGTTALRNRLAETAAATTPPLRVTEVRTLDELYSAQALDDYVGGFALVAATLSVLLLAAAGTYALMSFTVNDRRREIGVRVALGATNARLLGGVLKRALRQVLAAAAVGVAAAALIEKALPAGLSGAIDIPGVLPIAASFMMLVAVLATLGPARRVLRLDPNEALRDDG